MKLLHERFQDEEGDFMTDFNFFLKAHLYPKIQKIQSKKNEKKTRNNVKLSETMESTRQHYIKRIKLNLDGRERGGKNIIHL